MYSDPLMSPTPSAQYRHINQPGRGWAQAKAGSSRSMTEHGTVANGQYGGHVASGGKQRYVPDCVHAAMDLVQPAGPDSMLHRPTAEARLQQLLPAYDPMLARRKLGNQLILRCAVWSPYAVPNESHARSVAGRA